MPKIPHTPSVRDTDWGSTHRIRFRRNHHKVGSGKFGYVVQGAMTDENGTEQICAVKGLHKKPPHTPREYTDQRRITHDLGRSTQSGLLNVIGIFRKRVTDQKKPRAFVAFPLCHVTLEKCLPDIKLLAQKDPALHNWFLYKFLKQQLNALTHLNHKRTIHHDLKPANIYLADGENEIGEEEKDWVVADFGLSESYEEFEVNHVFGGTPLYIAPELLCEEKKFPFAVDIFSIGEIFRDLTGKKHLFENVNPTAMMYRKLEAYKKMMLKFELKHNHSTFNEATYQAKLRETIAQQRAFKQAFNYLTTFLMCKILPQLRPDIETRRFAINHIRSLVQDKSVELNLFYDQLIEKYGIKKEAISDNEPSESDVSIMGSPVTPFSSPTRNRTTLPPIRSVLASPIPESCQKPEAPRTYRM